jgi:hypothetical protein
MTRTAMIRGEPARVTYYDSKFNVVDEKPDLVLAVFDDGRRMLLVHDDGEGPPLKLKPPAEPEPTTEPEPENP